MYAATGRWILENGTIPTADPLSWTYAGAPWQSNGWGWGMVVDGAWRSGGFGGVVMLKPLFVFLIAAAVVFAARSLGARLVPGLVSSVAVVLLVMPWIIERPQLASLALFPLALGLAARATRDDRLRLPWLVAVVATFVIWANVHAVVLQGVLVVGTYLAALGIDGAARTRSVRPLLAPAVTGALIALAAFATPFGLSVLSYSSEVREISKATITEWFPIWRAGSDGVVPAAALVVAVVGIAVLRAWRRPELLAPLVVCCLLALDAVRNGPYLVIALAVFLVPLVPADVAPFLAGRRDLGWVAAGCALLVTLAVTVPRAGSIGAPSAMAPVAATDALPTACRLRNDYRVGGWVLFHRPDIPVSVDGRNDLYRIDGYAQQAFFEGSRAEDAAGAFADEGVDCVVALPGSPIIPALIAAGWAVRAEDAGGVLLLAPSA